MNPKTPAAADIAIGTRILDRPMMAGLTQSALDEAIGVRDTIPPAAPVNFFIKPGFGSFWGSWDPNTEADLLRYDIYASAVSTAPSGATTPRDKLYATTFVESGFGDGVSRYYWVRAVDTSLNASAWVAASSNPSTTIPVPGLAAA